MTATELVLVTAGGGKYHRVGDDDEPPCPAGSRSSDWRKKLKKAVLPTFDPCRNCFADELDEIAERVGAVEEPQRDWAADRVVPQR